MNYLYKLVTTEDVEINYDAFKKKELIECLATMRDIYFSLKQENQQLQEELECTIGIVEHNRIISEKNKEINQLKDNWIKLKEYCKENTLCYEVGDDENTKLIGSKIHGLNVLDKMQELEKSDSNE